MTKKYVVAYDSTHEGRLYYGLEASLFDGPEHFRDTTSNIALAYVWHDRGFAEAHVEWLTLGDAELGLAICEDDNTYKPFIKPEALSVFQLEESI